MPFFARRSSRFLVALVLASCCLAIILVVLGKTGGPAPATLRREFEAAVLEDSKQAADWVGRLPMEPPKSRRSPICAFGAKYGGHPMFMYRQLIHDYCGAAGFSETRFGNAALEALRCSRAKSGDHLAEAVFRDAQAKACHLSALNAWIMLSDEPMGEVLGRLLLDRDAKIWRLHVLWLLQSSGDLAALPYLDEAAVESQSAQEGDVIRRVRELISNPAQCVLVSKWYSGDAGWQGWDCQYGCAGPESSILVRPGEFECRQAVPNPNRRDAG